MSTATDRTRNTPSIIIGGINPETSIIFPVSVGIINVHIHTAIPKSDDADADLCGKASQQIIISVGTPPP